MNYQEIEVGQLAGHPDNVRSGGIDVSDLVASIRDLGLLQPLVVMPIEDTAEGLPDWHVVAGQRRLAAIRQLVKEGHFAHPHLVPCVTVYSLEEGDAAATSISLAENAIRTDMHWVDQVLAIHNMVQQGLGRVEIGRMFSLTEGEVNRRLRLAGVSAIILTDLKEEDAVLEAEQGRDADSDSIDVAKALSITTSKELQEEAWDRFRDRGPWQRAAFVRSLLRGDTMLGTAPLAVFAQPFLGEGTAEDGRMLDLFETVGEDEPLTYYPVGDVMDAVRLRLAQETLNVGENHDGEIVRIGPDGGYPGSPDIAAPLSQLQIDSLPFRKSRAKDTTKQVAVITIDREGGLVVLTGLAHPTKPKDKPAKDESRATTTAGNDLAEKPPAAAAATKERESTGMLISLAADINVVIAQQIAVGPVAVDPLDLLIFDLAFKDPLFMGNTSERWLPGPLGIERGFQTSEHGLGMYEVQEMLSMRDSTAEPFARIAKQESSEGRWEATRENDSEAREQQLRRIVAAHCQLGLHAIQPTLGIGSNDRQITHGAKASADLAISIIQSLGISFAAVWRPTADNYFRGCTRPLLQRYLDEMEPDNNLENRTLSKAGAAARLERLAATNDWLPPCVAVLNAPETKKPASKKAAKGGAKK